MYRISEAEPEAYYSEHGTPTFRQECLHSPLVHLRDFLEEIVRFQTVLERQAVRQPGILGLSWEPDRLEGKEHSEK